MPRGVHSFLSRAVSPTTLKTAARHGPGCSTFRYRVRSNRTCLPSRSGLPKIHPKMPASNQADGKDCCNNKPTMRTKTIAVLVTIAFSVIGVLGDYFLKLASAREHPLRTGWGGLPPPTPPAAGGNGGGGLGLPRLPSLRLDRVRLGIRNETPEAGHH